MHDAAAVGDAQGLEDAIDDRCGHRGGHGLFAAQERLQTRAFEQLDDEVGRAVFSVGIGLDDGDVRVPKRKAGFCFGMKALDDVAVADELRVQHLDGALALALLAVGFVYRSEPALADEPDELPLAVDDGANGLARLRHHAATLP